MEELQSRDVKSLGSDVNDTQWLLPTNTVRITTNSKGRKMGRVTSTHSHYHELTRDETV